MGLSRLDNFLKSSRGTILYVNPNDLDSTDSIENLGNSLTRPFRTIQRALVEAARFSYQRGLNNDRFGNTTILIYPGEHVIDNRPGFIPDGLNTYRMRNGLTTDDLPAFDLNSNFDVNTATNELYKLNSIHGGVIVPRGTSVVGLDLRKTKLRPKYVPDPENDSVESSAIFRITGGGYFWQFSIFDADPNTNCFKDYTLNTTVPNYSHHKLTCFEYADGVNPVRISDDFQTFSAERTDLDMYYEKVGLVYGQSSGRTIEPDYPSNALDIEKKIDEYRIVGSIGKSVGISSIRAGDGIDGTTTITVTTSEPLEDLEVDTPFRIQGITANGYDGQYVVFQKNGDSEIVYKSRIAPPNALPSVFGSSLTLSSDTVTSASPYIFNISLRSVFGMCGMHADGSKATGFRSMVVAQFTGIGLQKDDRAFVLFNQDTPSTGFYDDSSSAGNETISNNSRSKHKPDWKNVHIRCSNKAVIQAVSCFAIGFAEQFVTESGGDISLTNSNSNFGASALCSDGYREDAFDQDNQGYITHIIPPEDLPLTDFAIEYGAIDILKTLPITHSSVGVGSTGNLYLYNEKNSEVLPEYVIQGYRVGAKPNDRINFIASQSDEPTKYSARIVMPEPDSANKLFTSAEKIFNVGKTNAGINSIGDYSDGTIRNVITLDRPHNFYNGETIRVISSNGHLPDGLLPNTIYYAITESSDLTGRPHNMKLAQSLNDAVNDRELPLNYKGGELKVVSRVTDKVPGELGHPVQYDGLAKQWYVKVAETPEDNEIYPTIVGLGSTAFGDSTPRTFIERRKDDRSSFNRLYHARYVIPKNSPKTARPPVDGFIIQESKTSIGSTDEVGAYFGNGSITNINDHRNFRTIAGAEWSESVKRGSIHTEVPHNLQIGNQVEIINIQSSQNVDGLDNLGFNGKYVVSGISSAKTFTIGIGTNPGTFQNNTSVRTPNLPIFKKNDYNNVYYVYRIFEHRKYIQGDQDGIYYLTIVNASNKPTIAPFREESFSQPVSNLFPQTQRDNPTSDPESAICHARSSLIGRVDINDPRKSITRETVDKFTLDTNTGIGVTNIVSHAAGLAHTIYTHYDHGLNSILKVSVVEAGEKYGTVSGSDEIFYNARLVGIGTSVTGKNATAKITVDGSQGNITEVRIMDGGSAFGIGNTLNVVGVVTSAFHVPAVLRVESIKEATDSMIRVVGVRSESLTEYNQLYKVNNIRVGAATSLEVESISPVSQPVTNYGKGLFDFQKSEGYYYNTGVAIGVTGFEYDHTTGFADIFLNRNHGMSVGEKVTFFGADQDLYNGSFAITEVSDNLIAPHYEFRVKVGLGTESPAATGNIFVCSDGYSSNAGALSDENENLNGRMILNYDGINSRLTAPINDFLTENVRIANAGDYDINIGDYFIVNNEIIRVKQTTATSSLSGETNTNALRDFDNIVVFRGVMGTRPGIHQENSTIKRIKIIPVEFRRHSIIRASGHTFEYVGYGPGNYSTGFPDKQDREITAEEELLAQSTRRSGGVNFYTGMNDKGISYSGNKKLSTITGKENIFETPVQTVEGEDILTDENINVIMPLEGIFDRSIKVEGGADRKAISEFNGPIILNNKLTINSNGGVETNNIFLQGDAIVSRKYTVGLGTPLLAGNPGDVVYSANPQQGGNAGWIYTLSNNWKSFGTISLERDTKEDIFDRVGIGTTTARDNFFQITSGANEFSVDSIGHVGIGTSASGYALNVKGGNVNINEDLNVGTALTAGNRLVVSNGGVHVSGSSTVNGLGIEIIDDLNDLDVGLGVSVFSATPGQEVFFRGDGSGLVNLNANQTGWIRQNDDLSYEDVLNGRVGIGTSIPGTLDPGTTRYDYLKGYSLTVGSAHPLLNGDSRGVSLWIHDDAHITGNLRIDQQLNVAGVSTLSGRYNINNVTGQVVGYAATFSRLGVSTSATFNNVYTTGITTSISHTYLQTYSEKNNSISTIETTTGTLTLDLSLSQNFEVTITQEIAKIVLINPPPVASAMSFTIKFTQPGDTFHQVDIDHFEFDPGNGLELIPVKWPGGVVPVISQAVNDIDIYSFKTFNVSDLNNSGLYGVVGGQNFS